MAKHSANGYHMKKELNIKQLFEFQRFSGNPRLQQLIEKTESRYGCELSDDTLELVNAAGDMDAEKLRKKNGGGDDAYH